MGGGGQPGLAANPERPGSLGCFIVHQQVSVTAPQRWRRSSALLPLLPLCAACAIAIANHPAAPFPAQTDPLTLSAWILTQQHKSAGARGRLTVLLNAIGVGCKFVSSAVRRVRRPRGWGLVLFGEGVQRTFVRS